MKLEAGKYYKTDKGSFVHVITPIKTLVFGDLLITETNDPRRPLLPIYEGDVPDVWKETTEEEWMANFVKNEEGENEDGKGTTDTGTTGTGVGNDAATGDSDSSTEG